MNKKLILSVALCLIFAGGVFAQSAAKSGSQSQGSSSNGSSAKEDKAVTKAKRTLVSEMYRDFASMEIKLTPTQKSTLKQLVDSNYAKIASMDQEIAAKIPQDQRRALKKAFNIATKKEGKSEIEGMKVSMESISLSSDMQDMVLEKHQMKEDVKETIRTELSSSFNEEQAAIFAKIQAEKKAAMAAKEGSASKEEGSATKEAGSAKKEDGSATKQEGSTTKAAGSAPKAAASGSK